MPPLTRVFTFCTPGPLPFTPIIKDNPTTNKKKNKKMERPADDIFLFRDLSIVQSPASKHLFLGRSSDVTPPSPSVLPVKASPLSSAAPHITKQSKSADLGNTSSSLLSDENTVSNANEQQAAEPKHKAEQEQETQEQPVKRKRGRPPKVKRPAVVETAKVAVEHKEEKALDQGNQHKEKQQDHELIEDKQDDKKKETTVENPKIITLIDWSLGIVPNSPKMTGVSMEEQALWVVLSGRRLESGETWHSSIITERILHNHIKTGSGRSLYVLEGPMNGEEMQSSGTKILRSVDINNPIVGFSPKFVQAFKLGFPENWRELLMAELTMLEKTFIKPNGGTIAPGNKKKPAKQQPKAVAEPEVFKPEAVLVDSTDVPFNTADNTDTADDGKELKEKEEPVKVVKNKGGRPRKTPLVPAEEKNKPSTQPVVDEQPVVEDTQPKKEKDTPKKETPVVKKRGPGRPKKTPKRGPGRPRKSSAVTPKRKLDDIDTVIIAPPAKRRSGPQIKWGWGGKAVIQGDV